MWLCAGVPNPYPRYHTVAFNPGYETPDDASLASAWNITGPMVDGGACNFKILDCNLDNPGVVFPDPRNPLDPSSRPVACPAKPNATNATDGSNATLTNVTLPRQPVLRVYYGTACLLWRADNGYGCHWNNILQAFEGSACVRSTAPTQCMCRHLTDFASARVPKIETCSVQDMLSLKPGDIVVRFSLWISVAVCSCLRTRYPFGLLQTKLKFLFIVVISLFGVSACPRHARPLRPCHVLTPALAQ